MSEQHVSVRVPQSGWDRLLKDLQNLTTLNVDEILAEYDIEVEPHG